MKTTLLTAAFSVLALAAYAGTPAAPAPASAPAAEPFSYNFVEAGYLRVFPDQIDDLNGYYAHASYSPVQNLFLFAEWGQVFGDEFGVDFDISSLELGAGAYLPVCNGVDFVITGAGLRQEIDSDFGGYDEWGFTGSAGFRVRVAPQLELGAFYGFTSIDDEEISSASVGAVYSLTEAVDLTVRASFNDDEQIVGAGVRYNF